MTVIGHIDLEGEGK